MKTSLTGILLAAAFGVAAAEWSFSDSAFNRIEPQAVDASVQQLFIGRDAGSPWLWRSAHGVTFHQDDGNLRTEKTAGGSCHFSMFFAFALPLERFRLRTPLLQGVDFSEGGCRFEYSFDGVEFQPLAAVDRDTPGYSIGGSLPPVTGDWVEVPPGREVRELVLRMVLDGYVHSTLWYGHEVNGGILEVVFRVDPWSRAAVAWHPASPTQGFLWTMEELPRLSSSTGSVDAIRVFDAGREREAGMAHATPLGERTLWELPELPPGAYDLVFSAGGETVGIRRIALVNPPRRLDHAGMLRSPFGIVGISRTAGYRESAPLNGPEIAKRLGVHKERGGIPTWVTACEAGRGVFELPDSASDLAERTLETGILFNYSLAWTPSWAVDPGRVAPGEWAGHYPPRREFLADYAEYCRTVAAKYAGAAVQEYEIWNEPNNEPYGSFKGTFEEFVELCRTAAEAVHSVNPDARMILGTTGDPDVGYIVRLLKAGLSPHFQLVDIHPYRHTDQGPEDGLLGDITRLRRAVAEYGDNQGVIFTEVGWPTTRVDQGSYQKVSEFEQACFNSRTLLISLAGGVERIHFHMLEDWGRDPDEPEHHFGFFKVDGAPKLAVPAFNTTARHLEGASFLGRRELEDYLHVWYWRSPWAPEACLATVWADLQRLPRPPEVTLAGKLLHAEDLWGGTPQRIRVSGDSVTVQPGPDPIFLYLEGTPPALAPLPPDLRPNLIRRALARRGTPGSPKTGLAQPLIAGTASKAMAGAGIGDHNDEGLQRDGDAGGSAFDSWYDDRGLTFAVRAATGKPMRNDRRGWWLWAGDCVRLYLGRGDSGFMTDRHYQICIAPTSADDRPEAVLISYDAASGYDAGDSLPAEITAENLPEGWGLTVFMPWEFFSGAPQPGEVWKFDLTVPGAAWNGFRDDKWNNPDGWGELQFM